MCWGQQAVTFEEADFTEGRVKLGLPSTRGNQCSSGGGAEVANFKRLSTGRSAATWVLSKQERGFTVQIFYPKLHHL